MRFGISLASLMAALLGFACSAASSSSSLSGGLKSLAEPRRVYIGTAVDMQPFQNEPIYQETIKRNFNVLVAENAFKFSNVQPARNRYNFAETDALVNFAQAHGMKLRGHTLVWHQALPKWLTEGKFSRDEAIAILKNHITTLVGRYKGKIWAWDVVNEAVQDNSTSLRTDSFWYRTIGPDYIKLAFQFAHQADPTAVLYYNDYLAEDMGTKSNGVYQLVRDLKRQGVPIQGIGWQMHVQNGFKILPSHRANAKRLTALGLELSITELDVRIKLPTTPEKLTQQANSYQEVMQFCTSEPDCKALVMWGFTDKYSWIPGFFPGEGDALVLDTRYQPKPAYLALQQALQAGTKQK